MASFEAKGDQLVAEADKAVKSASSFLGSMFGGGSDKMEDAAEKYSRAGNSYKAAKKCEQPKEAP